MGREFEETNSVDLQGKRSERLTVDEIFVSNLKKREKKELAQARVRKRKRENEDSRFQGKPSSYGQDESYKGRNRARSANMPTTSRKISNSRSSVSVSRSETPVEENKIPPHSSPHLSRDQALPSPSPSTRRILGSQSVDSHHLSDL